MRADDGDVAWLRIWVVERDVLFHREMQDCFLRVGGCAGIFADVLTRHGVLDGAEGEGHDEC